MLGAWGRDGAAERGGEGGVDAQEGRDPSFWATSAKKSRKLTFDHK